MDEERRVTLEEVLNHNKLVESVQFSQPHSITPIKNIAEFYISNNPINRPEILFWLQKSMVLASFVKNQKKFDKIQTELSLLLQDFELE